MTVLLQNRIFSSSSCSSQMLFSNSRHHIRACGSYCTLHSIMLKPVYVKCVILSYFHNFCCPFNIGLALDPVLGQLKHNLSLRSVLILSSYLHLYPLKSLFLPRFVIKIVCAFLISSVCCLSC